MGCRYLGVTDQNGVDRSISNFIVENVRHFSIKFDVPHSSLLLVRLELRN